jgi:hypothetical protein
MPAGTLHTMTVTDRGSACRKRHLLIISRHHPALYEYVRERFAGEPAVAVILDRRGGRDRRAHRGQTDVERRSTDRRVRPDVDAALRMESMQFLTILPAAPCPSGEGSA